MKEFVRGDKEDVFWENMGEFCDYFTREGKLFHLGESETLCFA